MTGTLNAEQILQAAMVLPETARASLAADLLASLPDLPFSLKEDAAEYKEFLRRDAEMDVDPAASLSLTQFADEVRQARGA